MDSDRANVVRVNGELRLSLPARTTLTWFTDRPARHAGRTNLLQWVGTWSAVGFDTDPPNAAVLVTDRQGRERTHVVTLSNPRRAGSWVHIDIATVSAGSEAGYRHADRVRPGAFTDVQVFIDDAANPPCPSLVTEDLDCVMTDQPVAFRSYVANDVGAVSTCGIGDSGRVQWQVQANLVAYALGRLVHDGPLFANNEQVFSCSESPRVLVTVFPSTDGQTYSEIVVTNQSTPSASPMLLSYTLAATT
jgi:hypothetical protein